MKENKNATPISLEEFLKRINKKVHIMKNYFSLYITPKGEIIDCGYPECLGHNDISEYIYNHLDEFDDPAFKSCLKGLEIPFKQVPYYVEDYYNLLDIYKENLRLFWTIDKVLLGTEDRICQDMGFVKISINNKFKTANIVTPNTIFGKNVTAHQKEIVEKLEEYFNISFTTGLKSAQKENAKIAAEIQQYLNKINNPKTV